VTDWEVFKNIIKYNFYPIGYEEHQQIVWNYFRHRQGKSVEDFMIEFRKREIHTRVSLKSLDSLVNYLGTLFPQTHRKLIRFIQNTIDEAKIQPEYLEGDKRKQQTEPHKQGEAQEK
jgi:hypothetical protein